MSLSKRPAKKKRARLRRKNLKHEEYRTGSKSEPKRKPVVFDRRGQSTLTEHLFSASEAELRDSLRILDVEIKAARRLVVSQFHKIKRMWKEDPGYLSMLICLLQE